MQHTGHFKGSGWITWIAVGVAMIVLGQLALTSPGVLAQSPTPTSTSQLATPTTALTSTPTATPTPTATSTGAAPTATSTSATNRLVGFKVSDDDIIYGHCTLFSWVVRGDVGIVEFQTLESNSSTGILVSDSDSREECPLEDTGYRLLITWLDGTQEFSNLIIVEVDKKSDNGSGGGGSTGTPPPSAGTFVAVTPIFVVPPAAGVIVTPDGALGGVIYLPETGEMPTEGSRTTIYLLSVGGLLIVAAISLLLGRKLIFSLARQNK